MSRFRVAQQLVVDCARGATAVWLTTADAARMLQVSANGWMRTQFRWFGWWFYRYVWPQPPHLEVSCGVGVEERR